ncbi:MAG: sigma-70 family RNA polymerase sigma factor [Terrimicrobiaceae bacterium]|nr:sigma-70 family RNA polymerase sigma factor [Terrimicrobiaceae bacterium]
MSDLNDPHHDQFLRLFAEHGPALRTFARSLLPSHGDASEVMQDVAVVLWQKFGEFDSARDFRKWAFGVVRFEVLTFLRDKARDRHVFDNELVNRLADDASAAGTRHEVQREALEGCLQKLPKQQRALVLAAYSKGTRMDELAARRGQTAMSLYKMLHRIRRTLLECVRRAVAREELA